MDDDLIDSSELPLDRRSLLPGTGFFYPDSLDEDRSKQRAKAALDGAEAVVVTDADADGLGCVARTPTNLPSTMLAILTNPMVMRTPSRT